MSKYVCGIDIGTTGVKVMIFSLDGTVISSAYTEYACTFPQSGWVEQDGDMTWKKTCETCKRAVEKSGVNPKEIVSIGLSTQRCTIVPIDREGNPLCNSISWQDSRSFEEVEEIKRIVGEEKFYEITGYPLGTVLSVTEIMWIKKICQSFMKQLICLFWIRKGFFINWEWMDIIRIGQMAPCMV